MKVSVRSLLWRNYGRCLQSKYMSVKALPGVFSIISVSRPFLSSPLVMVITTTNLEKAVVSTVPGLSEVKLSPERSRK